MTSEQLISARLEMAVYVLACTVAILVWRLRVARRDIRALRAERAHWRTEYKATVE